MSQLEKIKNVNNHVYNKRNSLNRNMEILSNLFVEEGEGWRCIICGTAVFEPMSHVEADHLKYQGHKKINAIELDISGFWDYDNLYQTYNDEYSEREVKEGLCIHKHKLMFFEDYGTDNTIEHSLDGNFMDRKRKKWVIDNLGIFLQNYIKYCEKVRKEYDETENKATVLVNKILESLK